MRMAAIMSNNIRSKAAKPLDMIVDLREFLGCNSELGLTVEASKSWRSTGETSKRPSVSVALSS